MNWFKASAYSTEMGNLNSYLKRGFDPYDFCHLLPEFLKTNKKKISKEMRESIRNEDTAQLMEDWLVLSSIKDQSDFQNWAVTHHSVGQMPTDEPPYLNMDYGGVKKSGWLIHFTDNPKNIADQGFKYGFDDLSFRGLSVTTHFTEQHRLKHPGYNFAFDAEDARSLGSGIGKYGRHAVVFWGAGVKTYHYGDEEKQIVFWGPSINKNMIFPVFSNNGSWTIEDARGRTLKTTDDIMGCIEWIQVNWRMYQQIQQEYGSK